MVRFRQWLGATAVLALVGCEVATEPPASNPLDDEISLHRSGQGHRVSTTRGRGTYDITADLRVDFAHNAVSLPNGKAVGWFRQSVVFEGQLVEFVGKVTCVTFDAEAGRAWVGGIVVRNKSEHPGFMTDIHEPGKDVWFRVLDTGRHAEEPDRSTFLGFEGAAGIITSEEYCDAQIWPDENARTSPVTVGRIVNRAH